MQRQPGFYLEWVCCLMLGMISGQVQSQDEPMLTEEDFWQDVPTVMSVTRMMQPVNDAPVAVTVIDRRMIKASGAREIPELFRLVPGFIVGYHDGHTPSVSYHMSRDRFARQMQVLVDGRSIYTTAIGGIPWSTLHITLDDIDRIEVVRGPNSASYGANSFLGVINIITRHTVLDHGTSVKTNLGDEGVREVFLRHGAGDGKLDYRVTAGSIQDDGFPDRADDKHTRIASVRVDYALSNIDRLSFGAGVGTGTRGVENRVTIAELSPDRDKTELNHHQDFRWERSLGLGESVSVQFYHIFNRNFETFTTLPINLGEVASGIDWIVESMFIDFSRRTHRYDLELQHNVVLSDTLRAAWGGGLRDDQVWGGQNLMNDVEVHNHLKHGFMNLEWDPYNQWLVNAGAMIEDYSTTGTSISPRAGVNYRISSGHSVRLTASKAIRTPSMYEDVGRYAFFGSSNYYVSGTDEVFAAGPDVLDVNDLGTGNADVEEIISHEFGYHGVFDRGRAELDLKLYKDELNGLLEGSSVSPVAGDLDNRIRQITNRDFFTIEGLELEVKLSFSSESRLYFGYAYTHVDRILLDQATGLDVVEESRVAPKNAFSVLYMQDFNGGYSAGIGYYFTDSIQGWESGDLERVRDPVRRLDVSITKSLMVSGYRAELSLAGRNLLGTYEEMEVLRPVEDYASLNEINSSVYLSLKVAVD